MLFTDIHRKNILSKTVMVEPVVLKKSLKSDIFFKNHLIVLEKIFLENVKNPWKTVFKNVCLVRNSLIKILLKNSP